MSTTMVQPCVSTAVRCEACGRRISRKSDLARHMKTHATNKEDLMHRCPYTGCGYKTLQRSNLETHINVHTGKKPKKCPACNFRCADPGFLTRHRKEVHGYEPKPNSRSRSSGKTRNLGRQRTRVSPYPTSSLDSSSSTSVASPSAPFVDAYSTPRPQLLPLPELVFHPPCFSPKDPTQAVVKNNYAAFGTYLATDHLISDNSHLASNTSLTLIPGLSMTPEVPYPRVPEPKNMVIHGFDLPAPSVPDMISNETVGQAFENFVQLDEPPTGPSAPSSTLRYTVDDAFIPSLPLSVDNHYYSVDETLALSVPQCANSYNYTPGSHSSYLSNYDYGLINATYTPYSYPTKIVSFDGQSSQLYSFAPPDVGFYPQDAEPDTHVRLSCRDKQFPDARAL